MVFFPEVLFFVLNIIKKGPVEDTAAFLRHSHLWALVIMIGILPSFPKIKSIEQSIRRKIHRKALIPDGGKRLITQLKNYPQTFKPQKGYTEKVFTDGEICATLDRAWFTPDNLLFYNVFKIEYLLQRLEDWKGVEAIDSSIAIHKGRIKNLRQNMIPLKKDIDSLLNLLSLGKGMNQECITMLETANAASLLHTNEIFPDMQIDGFTGRGDVDPYLICG